MNIKASNVLAAKTARACDSCFIKRARWFCATDDVFLCQMCDAAIHSANSLASRHRKVRLHTFSCKASQPPAWFTKKPRTLRQAKATSRPSLLIVPEIGSNDPFLEENDEQLFCRVPIFDAFADELCSADMVVDDDQEALRDLNLKELLSGCEAELAADVESLIEADWATGSDDGIELVDGKDVREEVDRDHEVGGVIGCAHSQLEWEIDWTMENSRMVELGEEMKREDVVKMENEKKRKRKRKRKRMMLRLNYEAVIAAWASRGSLLTHGIRTQEFNRDEISMSQGAWLRGGDGGRREARVLRYREKRRTRSLSKKIRYEVRKLNADNRPRIKGRFVKTTPQYLSSSLPLLGHCHFQWVLTNKPIKASPLK